MSQPNLAPLRRVVAAHNELGIGAVTSDSKLVPEDLPIGKGGDLKCAPIWKITDPLPTNDNNNSEDGAERVINPLENFGLVSDKGSNFQMTELAPGAITPMHRTSSLDYDILIDGELLLVMEDGTETLLTQPGDTVVMKGAMHAWKNPSATKWCRWMSVLTSAQPAVVNDRPLAPALD
ncbi:cupin domain protein [Moniliophthora roreri MCA 2997]|uniref:Cupin domain protein n=1 Tax=Moniliophthora roreri (strain MCA 2997) TaxID=1381753 RepID=V2XVY5_MONRO|nr:cupin domain protein [Moniliophthora roreri MCA 2997]